MKFVSHLSCVVVGLVFIAAGVLKFVSLGGSELESTVVWEILGGSPLAFAGLVAFEVLLGGMLCLRIAPRVSGAIALVMLAAFSLTILRSGPVDEPLACGCAGAGASPSSPISLLTRNAVYGLAVAFGTTWRRTVADHDIGA